MLDTNYKLQTTNYKLQTTNYKLQTTNYKLQTSAKRAVGGLVVVAERFKLCR